MNMIERAIRATLQSALRQPVDMSVGPARSNSSADAVLAVGNPFPPTRFDVEIKGSLTPAGIAAVAAAIRYADSNPMIVTPHLTAAAMEACRALGVACADVDGNVFVRIAGSVVDIAGRPRRESRLLEPVRSSSRLTSRAGLQVVFVILAFPDLRGRSLRDIAAASGTSLGSVAVVMKELGDHRYMAETSAGRRLTRTRELFDLWVDGYRLRLYRRLRLGSYLATAHWWVKAGQDLYDVGGQWGGETALWLRASNLRPTVGIAYVSELPTSLLVAHRLRRTEAVDANAEFRQRFWTYAGPVREQAVPAPLIYADLISDDDPRLLAAAHELRATDETLRMIDDS